MADGFSGMAELIADLQALGPELEREARPIVAKHAEAAGQAVRAQYPVVTGNLQRGVSVRAAEPLRYQVRTRAPHAHLYEGGASRPGPPSRGTMPANPTFIPTVIRWRRQMVEQLAGIVRRSKVRGMTGSLDLVRRGD